MLVWNGGTLIRPESIAYETDPSVYKGGETLLKCIGKEYEITYEYGGRSRSEDVSELER